MMRGNQLDDTRSWLSGAYTRSCWLQRVFVAKETSEVVDERTVARLAFRRLRLGLLAQRVLLVAVMVGVWWLSSLSVPHYILPGPTRVWEALQLIVANGEPWNNLGSTLWRVVVGFTVGALIGPPIAIVLGANRRAGEFFEPVTPVVNRVTLA